jgi:hypothetical protein
LVRNRVFAGKVPQADIAAMNLFSILLGGFLFQYFGGTVRFLCGITLRWLGLSKDPHYTLREYIHGSERDEDDHWEKGGSHVFVNRVVGMIAFGVLIWLIVRLSKV